MREYLTQEEASINESIESIGDTFREAPWFSFLVVVYLFVFPAAAGLAVGIFTNIGVGLLAFIILQIGVFLVADFLLPGDGDE